MNLGLKMDLEYILEHIRDVFTGQPMVRSILARGSVATGEYVPGKSDIDITAVMEDYDFLSAHELRKDIAELSKQVGVRISVTYTNINELEQDINSGLHYHGSKC
ncbi:MAG: nucleotidyltransferase domain-containing protein, partial [Nanoarchaeota archaeon]|nr:nucleotidyltransferase domain-containing protein [Nanoarchaeota archaeon]